MKLAVMAVSLLVVVLVNAIVFGKLTRTYNKHLNRKKTTWKH